MGNDGWFHQSIFFWRSHMSLGLRYRSKRKRHQFAGRREVSVYHSLPVNIAESWNSISYSRCKPRWFYPRSPIHRPLWSDGEPVKEQNKIIFCRYGFESLGYLCIVHATTNNIRDGKGKCFLHRMLWAGQCWLLQLVARNHSMEGVYSNDTSTVQK